MFGLGLWEIVVIVLVALIVLGPERLPKVAKQLGRGMREFRKSASELQNTLEEAVYAEEDAELKRANKRPELKPPEGAQPRDGTSAVASLPAKNDTAEADADKKA